MTTRRARRPSARAEERPIALVTYRTPDGVPAEDRILARAFARRGVPVEHPVWDDPRVDWSSFAMAIVRSTWDYHHRRDAFLAWIGRARRRVAIWNSPRVLEWNTDKRYLADLARRGVPVVPTAWIRRGSTPDLSAILRRRRWTALVVKRSVSAAGDETYRFGPGELDRAQAVVSRLARDSTVMVQPYLEAIEARGERSLVYLGGRYSHAVRRVPIFPRKDPGARETLERATGEQRAVASATLAACPGELLYARVDLLPDGSGGWRLLELEVTEPSLFFVPCPRAADRLVVAALSARAR